MWEATEAKAELRGSVERESDRMKDGRAHKLALPEPNSQKSNDGFQKNLRYYNMPPFVMWYLCFPLPRGLSTPLFSGFVSQYVVYRVLFSPSTFLLFLLSWHRLTFLSTNGMKRSQRWNSVTLRLQCPLMLLVSQPRRLLLNPQVSFRLSL